MRRAAGRSLQGERLWQTRLVLGWRWWLGAADSLQWVRVRAHESAAAAAVVVVMA